MTIIVASPHRRFDAEEGRLLAAGVDFVRVRSKEDLSIASLEQLQPRYIFFPHWSWRIPADIFERFECVIFHMTDVPYGRGGSPLQNLIVRGHTETKLTALRCVAEMDAGPVYLQRPLSLLGTAEEILIRAGHLIIDMIVTITAAEPMPRRQQGAPTVFERRKPTDGALDQARTISNAYDLIRMLDAEGYPHAFADVGPFRIEFSRATLRPDEVVADVRISLKDKT